jgi:GntR family transcriptional regulator/MocR family aminotransferase
LGHSVGFKLDPRRDEAIHRQIFDQIVARIESRAFPPGYKLPATRVLARELKAHRNTVARAYADLEAAGFVCGSVGRGTFVEETQRPMAAVDRREPRSPTASQPMPWGSLVARGARPEILARAERWARRVDGRDVVNLARMQPSEDLLPAELMRRCMARVLAEHGSRALSYAPPEGVPRLREQLARELNSRGVPATAEDVLITSGSQQGLDLVARTLVNPGETLLVESTTYSGAIDLFTLAGARLVSLACDDDGPLPNALERVNRSDVKALYVMPTGHNPTGRTMSAERRRALVEWSRAAAVPIIEDDFVAGLSLEDREDPPHLRALDGEVIHLSTFSKRLIPSLRVGYLVVPAALRESLRSMKRVVDIASSAILQHSLAEFIERGYLRAHTTRVTREYRARRDALSRALRRNLPEEVTWHVPTHGIVLWLSLPAALDPDAVYEEALRQGVLVSPSSMWSVDRHPSPGLRLAFCAEPEGRLLEGAKRLGKAMKTLMAQAPRRAQGMSPRVLEAV